jgi:hypothetical protein
VIEPTLHRHNVQVVDALLNGQRTFDMTRAR